MTVLPVDVLEPPHRGRRRGLMTAGITAVSLLGACGQSPSGTQSSPTASPSASATAPAPIELDAVPSARISFQGDSLGLATAAGLLLDTTDGGKTWHQVLKASGPIRDLRWPGPGHALAVSADGVVASHDGGLTWRATNQSPMGRRVIALDFPDPTGGFGVTADGQLWSVTMDAGRFVRRVSTGLATVSSVSFVDPRHGWAVGPQGVSMTADTGMTWTVQTAPSFPGLPRPPLIHMAGLRHGYIVERYGAAAGTVHSGLVATDDGGGHWSFRSGPAGAGGPPTPLYATMPPGIDDVDVEGSEALLAVAVSDVVSGMQACTSGDGGERWTCTPEGFDHPAQVGTAAAAIVRLSGGRLVAVALTNGSVLEVTSSSDAGATWTIETQVPVTTP